MKRLIWRIAKRKSRMPEAREAGESWIAQRASAGIGRGKNAKPAKRAKESSAPYRGSFLANADSTGLRPWLNNLRPLRGLAAGRGKMAIESVV
jgi:hypothetical protein